MILLKKTNSISFCLEVAVLMLQQNTAFSILIDLDNTGNSYASADKQTFLLSNYHLQVFKSPDPSKLVKLHYGFN